MKLYEIVFCFSIMKKRQNACLYSLKKIVFPQMVKCFYISYIDTALSWSLQLKEHVPQDFEVHIETSRIGASM